MRGAWPPLLVPSSATADSWLGKFYWGFDDRLILEQISYTPEENHKNILIADASGSNISQIAWYLLWWDVRLIFKLSQIQTSGTQIVDLGFVNFLNLTKKH